MAEPEAAHPEIRCVYHATNKGKGGALCTGFANDRRSVPIQDADLEYDPNDYGILLQPILDGDADVVYGSRYRKIPVGRVHAFWHTHGNRVLTLFSNMMTDLHLSDMETCYKVFKVEVARRLDIQSRTFAVEPEMTAKIAKMGVRIYEVPISYDGRLQRGQEGRPQGRLHRDLGDRSLAPPQRLRPRRGPPRGLEPPRRLRDRRASDHG